MSEHRLDDVRLLALQASKYPEVDMSFALDQIAGWQTARKKLPTWAACNDIVYPPHLNMEQCSSEQTARYKAHSQPKVKRLIPQTTKSRFVDLTGGFGVDFYFMSQGFDERIYVEQNPQLCAISSKNFESLGLQATIANADAEAYLQMMEPADVIYMDPARRNEHGGRTYSIADCTPNIQELLPMLTVKTQCLILKLSPMLDWRKAVDDLNEASIIQHPTPTILRVSEIHIVSVQNECKELVIVMNQQTTTNDSSQDIHIACVNLLPNDKHEVFNVHSNDSVNITEKAASTSLLEELGVGYLFEPNASVMKAGCFAELSRRFHLQPLAANSHLFLTDEANPLLPGRLFYLDDVSTMNKKALQKMLSDVDSANITVRNFPMSVAELRKRLKLKDGGDTYLFATTLSTGKHVLIKTRKV